MSANRKTVVGVIFGGRSVEHDVSVVTAHQIMQAFKRERYEVIPVYITRDGKWFTGEPLSDIENFKDPEITSYKSVHPALLSPDIRHHGLIVNPAAGRFSKSEIIRLDVVFPAVHGTHGEDGTLQGLFELADIPYVGCATLASALTNDKLMTKQVLRQVGIPVLDEVAVTRTAWLADPESTMQNIRERLEFPLFVKPATLGSSIGVSRVEDERLLRPALDVALNFDRRVLVEPCLVGCIEINCAVLGSGDSIETSVLEQPVSWDEFLSYEDKYLRGSEGMKSADRLIPAPLEPELTDHIREMAAAAFRAVDGRGTARIDFLVRREEAAVYLNELNTMPGSLAFYLWRETGLSPEQVVDRLVALARESHADKRRNIYDYQTNLLALAAARGSKGLKGSGVKSAAGNRN